MKRIEHAFIILMTALALYDPIASAESVVSAYVVPEGTVSMTIWELNEIANTADVVVLPSTLIDIEGAGKESFFNTTIDLERIIVAVDNPVFHSEDGILFDEDSMLVYPKSRGESLTVTDMMLHDAYSSIEVYDGMLYRATMLKSVSFETETETAIPAGMFSSCTSLERVSLPMGLRSIGAGAFRNCISLTSIALPPTLVSISHGAFSNCASLKSVIIPDSVKIVGDYAFDDVDGFVIYASLGSAGSRYAALNNILWAEKPGDTPRFLNVTELRRIPAAVVNGPSGGETALRREPNQNAASLGSYPNGTTVFVLSDLGSYTRVRLGGVDGTIEGYILSERLQYTDALTSVVPLHWVKGLLENWWGESQPPIMVYETPLDNSRSQPFDWFRVNESMIVEDVLGTWLQVVSFDGDVQGYVKAQDVIASRIIRLDPAGEDYDMTGQIEYSIVVNPRSSDRLNLREKPDSNSTSLGRYYNGTIVEIIEGQGDWALVSVDGKNGYMMTQYLRQILWQDQMPMGNG